VKSQIEIDATRFADFLLEKYPRARDWPDPVGFCGWSIACGFIAAVTDAEDSEKIVAMCAMRPVDRAGFGVLPYYFNENGSCLHCDLFIDTTDDERATLAFRRLFTLRFGPRKTVTLFRGDETAIHVYRWKSFFTKLTAMKRAKMMKQRRTKEHAAY
jgi:hypothetical protein